MLPTPAPVEAATPDPWPAPPADPHAWHFPHEHPARPVLPFRFRFSDASDKREAYTVLQCEIEGRLYPPEIVIARRWWASASTAERYRVLCHELAHHSLPATFTGVGDQEGAQTRAHHAVHRLGAFLATIPALGALLADGGVLTLLDGARWDQLGAAAGVAPEPVSTTAVRHHAARLRDARTQLDQAVDALLSDVRELQAVVGQPRGPVS